MRSKLIGLALLSVIAGAAVPASAQGYYDRLYRGASPEPSDARPDQLQRQEENRAARAARRQSDDDQPTVSTPRGTFNDDRNGCDPRQSGRDTACGR
jgi:hypothetical protein